MGGESSSFWGRLRKWGESPVGITAIVLAVVFKFAVHLPWKTSERTSAVPQAEKTAIQGEAIAGKRNARHVSEFRAVYPIPMGRSSGYQGLSQIIEGLYSGNLSAQEARQYAFRRGLVVGCGELKNVAGEYLIYHFRSSDGILLEFATPRNREFEGRHVAENEDVADYYHSNRGAQFDAISLVGFNAVTVVAVENFTTMDGFVKAIPVVQPINLIP